MEKENLKEYYDLLEDKIIEAENYDLEELTEEWLDGYIQGIEHAKEIFKEIFSYRGD